MKNKETKLTLDQEIVLSCAMRYALGRKTYVVGSVCSELIKAYYKLDKNQKARIAKEIQEYQNDYGEAGMSFDNDEWNKVKWLFDENNRIEVSANYYNTDKWETVIAIKAENGKYYSIPEVNEYHTVKEL